MICWKDLQDSAYSHIHVSNLLKKKMDNEISSKKAQGAKSRGNKLLRHKFTRALSGVIQGVLNSFSVKLWQYMWSVVCWGSSLETLEACAGFLWTSPLYVFPLPILLCPAVITWVQLCAESYESSWWIFKSGVILGTCNTPSNDQLSSRPFQDSKDSSVRPTPLFLSCIPLHGVKSTHFILFFPELYLF